MHWNIFGLVLMQILFRWWLFTSTCCNASLVNVEQAPCSLQPKTENAKQKFTAPFPPAPTSRPIAGPKLANITTNITMRILSVVYEAILYTHDEIAQQTSPVLADVSSRPRATE
jgi:hypothetical protein